MGALAGLWPHEREREGGGERESRGRGGRALVIPRALKVVEDEGLPADVDQPRDILRMVQKVGSEPVHCAMRKWCRHDQGIYSRFVRKGRIATLAAG